MSDGRKSLSNCRFSLCYKAKRTVGFSPMAYNVLWLCVCCVKINQNINLNTKNKRL